MTEEERSPRLLHRAVYTFPFLSSYISGASFKPQAKNY